MKYNLELKRANVILGSGGEVTNAIWGTITGDITQQKDLQAELEAIKESIPEPYNDTQVKEDVNHLKEEKADKSELPDISNLATKEELSSSLLNKANKAETYTKQEVDNKIADSGNVDLTNYYTKEEIEGKNYLTVETDPTVPDWAKQPNKPVYTANEVGALPDTTKIPDITGLATKTELAEGLATKADLSSLNGLATKKELEGKVNSGDVYTKTEIDSKNYLTTIPDTYASKEYVSEEIAKIPEPDFSNYYNKAEVDNKIEAIPKTDLSAYSTTVENDTKYQPKGSYLIEVPAEYITETKLTAKNYATKAEVAGKADSAAIPTQISQLTNDAGYLTAIPDEYVTDAELEQKGYITDISGKADKAELLKYALKAELPTIDITKAYVDEALAEKADKTAIPDISDLATKNELASGLSTKADISLLNSKVDKVEGKSLISDSEISRLATVVNYNDTELRTEIATKANADTVYTKEQVDSKLTATYKFRGSVDNYAALPKGNNTIGDVYNLLDTGYNYAYAGEGQGELKDGWDNLSGIVDLSEYQKTESADSKYVVKETGKSLVSNSEIERLSTVTNYDDTIVKTDIANIQNSKADKTDIPDITGLATKAEVTTGLSSKADLSSLNGKVDKIEGKGLSTNDYTNDAVAQLAQLWTKGII